MPLQEIRRLIRAVPNVWEVGCGESGKGDRWVVVGAAWAKGTLQLKRKAR